MPRRYTTEETPVRRGLRLATSLQTARKTRESYRRMQRKLSAPIVEILDKEAAPLNVCRWVSWGKWSWSRGLRLALALWLRRPASDKAPGERWGEWAWGSDTYRATAEKLFYETPQYAGLVRAGVIPAEGLPDAENARLFTVGWEQAWAKLEQSVSTLNREKFTSACQQAMKVRSPARSKRKRKKKVFVTSIMSAYADMFLYFSKKIMAGENPFEELYRIQR